MSAVVVSVSKVYYTIDKKLRVGEKEKETVKLLHSPNSTSPTYTHIYYTHTNTRAVMHIYTHTHTHIKT